MTSPLPRRSRSAARPARLRGLWVTGLALPNPDASIDRGLATAEICPVGQRQISSSRTSPHLWLQGRSR
jgi:hypothetical protein